MKRLLSILIFLLIICHVLNGQNQGSAGQFDVWIKNNSNPIKTVRIEWEKYSSNSLVWDAVVDYPDLHHITSVFNSAFLETQTNERLEFYICWNDPGDFGLGYYKVVAKVNGDVKDEFFIDYRTSSLPEDWTATPPYSGNGDINIDFDVQDEEFYYNNTNDPFPSSSSIYCSIWGLKDHIDHETTEFEPYEPNNLSWYRYYNHPRLQWSHSSNLYDYVTDYEIHLNQGSGWELIETRPSILLYYVDWEIDLGKPPEEEYLYYKVRSKNCSRVSDNFSNVVKVAGPGEFQKKSINTIPEPDNIYEWKLE